MKTTKKKPGPKKTKGRDPLRSMRVPDLEWRRWQVVARKGGVSLTAMVRKAINRYVKGK